MEFCKVCEARSKCVKICDKLEKFLRRRKIGGYSARHKRKMEVIVAPETLEIMAIYRAFHLRYGKSYFKNQMGGDDD